MNVFAHIATLYSMLEFVYSIAAFNFTDFDLSIINTSSC